MVRTNTLSIIAIIAGFMMPFAGIVLGYVALSQIRRTGEEGKALAVTGIIAGIVLSLFFIAFFILWFSLLVTAFSQSGFWPTR